MILDPEDGMDRVEGTRPRPTRRGLSPQLVAIAALALVLRAYPLHVFYIHPDQEWIPTMAMQSLAAGNWRPELLLYGLFRPIGPDAPLTEALVRSRGPLLELPAQGPWAEAASIYRSIFHRRPLLNGYSGYWPAGYAERMALARRLPDPAAVRELERTTGLRQIVVHTAGYRPEERRVWIELADRGGDATLALVARDGPDLLFDVVRGANSAQHHGPGFGTTGDARDRHERTAARVALPHSRDDTPARAAWTALAERDAGGRFALVARDGDDLPDGGGGGAPRAVPGILNRIVGLRSPIVARC